MTRNQRADCIPAGFQATPAYVGASATMFVFLGVTVALLTAEPAGLGPGLKRLADHGLVAAGAAGGNRPSSKA